MKKEGLYTLLGTLSIAERTMERIYPCTQFFFIVFIISNGMFLYENWFKQCRVINKAKKQLPEGCDMLSIKFDSASKAYKITLNYLGKPYRITVEYPSFYISEKGVRALGPLNIDSRKSLEENKSLIMDYMS